MVFPHGMQWKAETDRIKLKLDMDHRIDMRYTSLYQRDYHSTQEFLCPYCKSIFRNLSNCPNCGAGASQRKYQGISPCY